jgi:hypothetical protein
LAIGRPDQDDVIEGVSGALTYVTNMRQKAQFWIAVTGFLLFFGAFVIVGVVMSGTSTVPLEILSAVEKIAEGAPVRTEMPDAPAPEGISPCRLFTLQGRHVRKNRHTTTRLFVSLTILEAG